MPFIFTDGYQHFSGTHYCHLYTELNLHILTKMSITITVWWQVICSLLQIFKSNVLPPSFCTPPSKVSTLNMKAPGLFEMLVPNYQTTYCHDRETMISIFNAITSNLTLPSLTFITITMARNIQICKPGFGLKVSICIYSISTKRSTCLLLLFVCEPSFQLLNQLSKCQ
jgi:hypothetical protein